MKSKNLAIKENKKDKKKEVHVFVKISSELDLDYVVRLNDLEMEDVAKRLKLKMCRVDERVFFHKEKKTFFTLAGFENFKNSKSSPVTLVITVDKYIGMLCFEHKVFIEGHFYAVPNEGVERKGVLTGFQKYYRFDYFWYDQFYSSFNFDVYKNDVVDLKRHIYFHDFMDYIIAKVNKKDLSRYAKISFSPIRLLVAKYIKIVKWKLNT